MQYFEDSLNYLRFSRAIQFGEFLRPSQTAKDYALVIRTPGYPLLLSGFQRALTDTNTSVIALHFLLGVLTLVYLMRSSAESMPRLLPAAGALFVFAYQRYYFWSVLTEWAATCFLLMIFMALSLLLSKPSGRRMLWCGLLCSYCALIRPALVILPLLLFAVLLMPVSVPPRRKRPRLVPAFLAAMLPIVLWLVYNAVRLDTSTLAPFEGFNLFGSATLLQAAAEAKPDDMPQMIRFIKEVNEQKVTLTGEPGEYAQHEIEKAYNHNVWTVGFTIARNLGADAATTNRMMRNYAWRVISKDPAGFILLGVTNFKRSILQTTAFFLLSVTLSLAAFLSKSKKWRPFALSGIGFCFLHVLHMVLCAFMQASIPRYEDLTMSPLFMVLLILLWGTLEERGILPAGTPVATAKTGGVRKRG